MSLPMLTEFQASSYWNGAFFFLHYYASFFGELQLFHNFPSSFTKEIKTKKTRNKLSIKKNQNAIIESTENKANQNYYIVVENLPIV